MNAAQLIVRLAQVAAANKFAIERLASDSANNPCAVNIPTERFDLARLSDNRWIGTLIVYPDATFAIEAGGRHNWTERFSTVEKFKEYLRQKAA
jgi:hypothetical protein